MKKLKKLLFFRNNFFVFDKLLYHEENKKLCFIYGTCMPNFIRKYWKPTKLLRFKVMKRLFLLVTSLVFHREITNKNSLFRTSNLNNFVSFQYFLMKFCMQVPEIKLHFFFSSCYYNFWETKKLYRKNSNFWHFFTFSPFFCKLWTLITFSIFIGSLWNLVCCFLSFHSIFSTFNVVIICQK